MKEPKDYLYAGLISIIVGIILIILFTIRLINLGFFVIGIFLISEGFYFIYHLKKKFGFIPSITEKEFKPYLEEKPSIRMKIFFMILFLSFFSLFIITISVYSYYNWCLTLLCYNMREAQGIAIKYPTNSFEWTLFIGLPFSWGLSGVPTITILFLWGRFNKKSSKKK